MLFFLLQQLTRLNPMYSFALPWFQEICNVNVDTAPLSNSFREREHYLSQHLQLLLFRAVHRSLFTEHQPLFAFGMALQVPATSRGGERYRCLN